MERLKSKAAWATTFGFIFFILKTYLGIEIPKADELVNGILLLGTVWGIWNNPTNSSNF